MTTSTPTRPATQASGGREPEPKHMSGMTVFSVVLLLVLALFNGLDGIAGIARSRVFVDGAHYVFWDLRAWGWVILAIAVLQLAAALSVIGGGVWGRWFGIAMLGLNAFAQMFFVPSYPFWSLTIIAIDIVAIYGLCLARERRAFGS